MSRSRSREPRGYSMSEIPPFVQYTSPVSTGAGSQLPLNLIARIIGYLDDIGDIARVTRTSRLLYYMTLPQLYQHVALHSYPDIKYVNGRPEGFGSGSPFMMALNGLVTKSYAGVVRDFRLWGEWKEVGVEDFAKGRVPDNSMMLNMMLRVCVDKMAKLQSFSWELDCKPLKTLYQGLAARDTLTSLTLKFPSSRLPRPAVVIPPMPNLKAFRAIDIDPLCYPDDISVMLLSSRNLIDVRLHFSPRMRQTAEPTLSLETYYGRCWKAGYMPKYKHFAMQNWFGPNANATHDRNSLACIMDIDTCQSMCFLDTFGGATGGSANVYVDDTWKDLSANTKSDFRSVRFNEFAEQHVAMMKRATGLERIYVVNDRAGRPAMSSTTTTPASGADYITPDDSPTASSVVTAGTATTPSSDPRTAEILSLGQGYLSAFTTSHGATLQHLLLSHHWPLNEVDLSNLIRACPNLSQLGVALGFPDRRVIRLLVPFLPNLYALRILENDVWREQASHPSDEEVCCEMGRTLVDVRPERLRWVGEGERVFAVGAPEELFEAGGVVRRVVRRARLEDVQGVEIWGLDRLDVMADRGPLG